MKIIVFIELTVPWEERDGEADERKRYQYDELIKRANARALSFPVEIGCRGFPAQSVWRLFSVLGVTGRCRRTAAQKMGSSRTVILLDLAEEKHQ